MVNLHSKYSTEYMVIRFDCNHYRVQRIVTVLLLTVFATAHEIFMCSLQVYINGSVFKTYYGSRDIILAVYE